MRVASQMGFDSSYRFTSGLPFASTGKYSGVDPVPNLNSSDILTSLGFALPPHQKLNNELSAHSSVLEEDNSQ